MNGRSVKENNTEFKADLEYIKPDIICGTESWLRGKNPGKHSKKAIKTPKSFRTIIECLEMTGALAVAEYFITKTYCTYIILTP